uniref:Putative secreted protein n=1 Tax=Ixodes ricinus TaxID=34613 RepID=A0A6B0UKI2_IXORI
MHDIVRETMLTLSFVQVLLTAALATTSPPSPGNLLHDPLTRDDSWIPTERVSTGPPMLSPTARLTRPDPDAYIFDAWQHASSGTSGDPCLRIRYKSPPRGTTSWGTTSFEKRC